jgi:hypothetical protein
MIRLLLAGAIAAAAALGGMRGFEAWEARRAAALAAGPPVVTEQRRAKPLTVPIVQDGALQGYIILQLAYVVDATALKASGLDPEPYLLDEAFRHIYGDASIDFRRLEKYDVDLLKRALDRRLPERLKTDAVKEVLIHEFNYVAKSDLR